MGDAVKPPSRNVATTLTTILATLVIVVIAAIVGLRAYWTFDAIGYITQTDKPVVLRDLGTIDLAQVPDCKEVSFDGYVVCLPSDWVVQWKQRGGGAAMLGLHHRTIILSPWDAETATQHWIDNYTALLLGVPESWSRELNEVTQRERSDWKAWWIEVFGPQEPVSRFSLDYRAARLNAITSRLHTRLFDACGVVCVARCGDVWGMCIERCDQAHLVVLSFDSDRVRQTIRVEDLDPATDAMSSCEVLQCIVRAWALRRTGEKVPTDPL